MAGDPMSPSDGGPNRDLQPAPSLAERLAGQGKRPNGWARMARQIWSNKKQRWAAIGVASMLLISFIAGIAWYYSHKPAAQQDYVEVYVTDLPANFSKLEIRIAGVYVGDPNYTLQLEVNRFDLLSLRGPEDALLLAKGNIPAGDHQSVRIVFQSARALLNGAWVSMDLPDQMLTVNHDFSTKENPSSAFLFDIDVEDSVRVMDDKLVFRPHVAAIYHHSFSTGVVQQIASGGPLGPGGAPQTPQFKDDSKKAPLDQGLGKPSGSLRPSPSPSPGTSQSNGKFTWNVPESSRPPTSASSSEDTSGSPTDPTISTPPTDTAGYLPSMGDAASVPEDPTSPAGWFVRFKPTIRLATDMEASLHKAWNGKPGAPPELVFIFASEAAAYVFATPEQAWELAFSPDIEYVEADRKVVFTIASSTQAIRLPQVHDPLLGLKDPQGRALDGEGVGVAVIDVGMDGTHPDLPHKILDNVNPLLAVNYKVESLFTVDAASTDLTSGHGTHVLGILGGRGVLDPTQRGVAPGITAYGFGIGEASTTLWPNTALDWIVQNHDKVDPPIKVVQNSWGSGNAYDPNSLTTRLIEQLIDKGITVVFSAGNAGGDGSLAATTSQCQIPKPGLLCVAAMDEKGVGLRDGSIASYSSRGKIGAPASWPDLSAPGTAIRSARPLAGSVTGVGALDAYTLLSGTSMAAPHVSGIIALMQQARPGLSPAQIESILEQTAYKFEDGGAYGADGHHAKGHGLADAYAAISLAKQS